MSLKELPTIKYDHALMPATETLLQRSSQALSESHPHIWRGNRIHEVQSIELGRLDRIGGEDGFGGSHVFVAALNGMDIKLKSIKSIPLLIKVVENDTRLASNLIEEQKRYEGIQSYLSAKFHAVPLGCYPPEDDTANTRILWSEFIVEDIVAGLPNHAPPELKSCLEKAEWTEAMSCLNAAYDIWEAAHSESSLGDIDFLSHYEPYLRRGKGWEQKLRTTIGGEDKITVFGLEVANPLRVLSKMDAAHSKCTGHAMTGIVHGDFHPRNILIGKIQRATIIDFGWANTSFHTIIDYVLMENSLKFFYLPWNVSRYELANLERDLVGNFTLEVRLNDPWLQGTKNVLDVVRNRAINCIDEQEEHWDVKQYFLPSFLVAMGMFAFASKVNNLEYLILSAGLLASRLELILEL